MTCPRALVDWGILRSPRRLSMLAGKGGRLRRRVVGIVWMCEIDGLDSSRGLGMTVRKGLGMTGGRGRNDTERVWVGSANAHSVVETL